MPVIPGAALGPLGSPDTGSQLPDRAIAGFHAHEKRRRYWS